MAPADPLSGLDGARLILVSGKGGVGKTTVAAALAARAAAAGRRVLLVSTDGRGDAAALFGKADRGYEEVDLAPGLFGLTAEFDALLADFVRTIAPVGFVASRDPRLGDVPLLHPRHSRSPRPPPPREGPGAGPREEAPVRPRGPRRPGDRSRRLAALHSPDGPRRGPGRARSTTSPPTSTRSSRTRRRAVLVVVAEPAEFAAREAEELVDAARESAGLQTALLVVNRIGRSGRAETLPRGDLPIVRVPELDVPRAAAESPFAADQAFFAAFRPALEGSPPPRRRGAVAAPPGPGDLDLERALRDERLVVLARAGRRREDDPRGRRRHRLGARLAGGHSS